MPIVFSDHAEYQIKRRKISKKTVLKAVQHPDRIVPSYRGRRLRKMRIGDKMIEVVTKTEGSRITVVSAYYLED